MYDSRDVFNIIFIYIIHIYIFSFVEIICVKYTCTFKINIDIIHIGHSRFVLIVSPTRLVGTCSFVCFGPPCVSEGYVQYALHGENRPRLLSIYNATDILVEKWMPSSKMGRMTKMTWIYSCSPVDSWQVKNWKIFVMICGLHLATSIFWDWFLYV